MIGHGKSLRPRQGPEPGVDRDPVGEGHPVVHLLPGVRIRWLVGRALPWAFYGTLAVFGAMAVAAFVLAARAGSEAAADPDPVIGAQQQAAGAYGATYVAAWLRATAEDPGDLATYVRLEAQDLPERPREYRDLAVSSVTGPHPGGVMAVVVSANVADPAPEAQDAPGWPRRYFQVTVNTAGGGLSVVGWPAPVAAPAAATDPAALAYALEVPGTHPLVDSLRGFLTAYTAGDGDLERYTAPDAHLTPITPASCEAVEILSVFSAAELPAIPEATQELHVLVQARLHTRDQSLPVSYALTVISRDGRWEVRSLQTRPHVLAHPSGATGTPAREETLP